MKIENLSISLSQDDILNSFSYQDKIRIKSLSIGKETKLNAVYKVVGVNMEFDATLVFDKLENNIIYINIVDFALSKKYNMNSLIKKSVNFIINTLSSIRGLYVDSKLIKINLNEIINSYLVEEHYLSMNNLEISSITFKNTNNINFIIKTLDFDVLEKK